MTYHLTSAAGAVAGNLGSAAEFLISSGLIYLVGGFLGFVCVSILTSLLPRKA